MLLIYIGLGFYALALLGLLCRVIVCMRASRYRSYLLSSECTACCIDFIVQSDRKKMLESPALLPVND
jgi:hypothetical protein